MTEPDRHEVYFEFVAIGNVVKVTAIDSVTGTEVSAMGPTSASQADLHARFGGVVPEGEVC